MNCLKALASLAFQTGNALSSPVVAISAARVVPSSHFKANPSHACGTQPQ